ncbi:hypothetical protein [Streptomyces cinereoruber]|uniref:hypothetical protein n=1 Tax=Streptomyces cinereoruber TaxID=67260 RepID=UPI00365F6D13
MTGCGLLSYRSWPSGFCRALPHTTPRAAGPNSHARQTSYCALANVAAALEEISPTVRELEALWTRRETGVAL